jgi:hypothetical protein
MCGVALATLTLAFAATPALAFEPGAHVPFIAGSTDGVPIGVIPPDGFYLGSLTTYAEGTFHPDSRPKHPNTLSLFTDGVALTWVPDIALWGTRYAASVGQPVVVATVTGIPPRGATVTESGLGNTTISPLNLAWTLPSDVYVSARFAFQPQDGQYDRHNLVNVANNFWTFEPNVGISYLKNGLDISVRLLYDIVTENRSSSARANVNGTYQSGNVFTAEYTVSQSVGRWRFGVTGDGVQQTNDDAPGGRTLHGTELSRVGIGPIIEYNARWIGVNLYYIHDVAWRGTFGGDNFFLRVTVKF